MKQVVRDFMNQAVKNPDDAALRRNMVLNRVARLGLRGGRSGRPIRVLEVTLDERGMAWQ